MFVFSFFSFSDEQSPRYTASFTRPAFIVGPVHHIVAGGDLLDGSEAKGQSQTPYRGTPDKAKLSVASLVKGW